MQGLGFGEGFGRVRSTGKRGISKKNNKGERLLLLLFVLSAVRQRKLQKQLEEKANRVVCEEEGALDKRSEMRMLERTALIKEAQYYEDMGTHGPFCQDWDFLKNLHHPWKDPIMSRLGFPQKNSIICGRIRSCSKTQIINK